MIKPHFAPSTDTSTLDVLYISVRINDSIGTSFSPSSNRNYPYFTWQERD